MRKVSWKSAEAAVEYSNGITAALSNDLRPEVEGLQAAVDGVDGNGAISNENLAFRRGPYLT